MNYIDSKKKEKEKNTFMMEIFCELMVSSFLRCKLVATVSNICRVVVVVVYIKALQLSQRGERETG